MRELLVLRHAKSRWDQQGTADHDRGLAPRGITAAGKMGALIANRGWLPDRILCSTATRARETLALARQDWPEPPAVPTRELATLYLAAPGRLLDMIRRQPDGALRLMLIGHNPGLQDFVSRLAGHGDAAGRAAIASKFPTAALALVALDIATWRDLDWNEGRLVAYHTPRAIDAANR